MTLLPNVRVFSLIIISLLFTGCFGSGAKPIEPDICEVLDENDEWLQPIADAQSTYGTPVSLTLSLLEQPLSNLDKHHVLPRTSDWDEYRVRTENWAASPQNIHDAVDFIGWFSRESVIKNQISWENVSAHYLAYRLGHGGYYRYDVLKYPELQIQAKQVEKRSFRWQQSLQRCQLQWQNESWFSKLKFW